MTQPRRGAEVLPSHARGRVCALITRALGTDLAPSALVAGFLSGLGTGEGL